MRQALRPGWVAIPAAALSACTPAPGNDAAAVDPGGPVEIGVSAGTCRATLNGKPVSIEELARLVTEWDRREAQVTFQPDPQAEFECVDRVLAEVRKGNRMKLGFVGNEEFVGNAE